MDWPADGRRPPGRMGLQHRLLPSALRHGTRRAPRMLIPETEVREMFDFSANETVARGGRSLGRDLFPLLSDPRFQDLLRRMNFPQ